MTRRALISVYDKTGVVDFARNLISLGWEIVSSSGTARALTKEGIKVTEVSDLTGFPHILGGRVKTLHPFIEGGILARRDLASDMKDIEDFKIPLIDMVVCTLYPFEETVKAGGSLEDLIEKIDIGGVTLLRAAAKNYHQVTIICDINDYSRVYDTLLNNGDLTGEMRQELALKAFSVTSRYDSAILSGLSKEMGVSTSDEETPENIPLSLDRAQPLRYGENPHQTAGLYVPPLSPIPWEQLAGKPLSYNNILDLDGALRGMSLMQQDGPAAVVLKHTTPCGMAKAEDLGTAYEKAFECDSISAFGGIVGLTRAVDLKTAEAIGNRFTEIVVAPDFEEEAVEYLKGKRPNLRLIKWTGGRVSPWQMTGTWSGMLVQRDVLPPLPDQTKGEWIGEPRPDLWEDLTFAWKVACISKSNSVALVKDGVATGIGMGFCSRVFAVDFAVKQAGEKAKGSVLASDAFFPFADGIEKAAEAGVVAIIQPGGSMRDAEVCKRAKELGVSMFLSGWRTFRH